MLIDHFSDSFEPPKAAPLGESGVCRQVAADTLHACGIMRLFVLLMVGASGCGDLAVTSSGSDEASQAQSKLDVADRGCTVALRSLTRVVKNGGYETSCASGKCWVVWAGTVDIAAQSVAQGDGKAFALYRNRDDATWSQVEASLTNDGPVGFVRYSFRLERNTMADGLSSTGIARTRIEVAPFWRNHGGDRFFDKQRGQGDFENYLLSIDNQFAVAEDAKVCPPQKAVSATLDFSLGWRNEQRGALIAGSTATTRYAIERLPECRGTHNGYPAWDIRASVRFSPGGQVVDGTVRGFDGPTPTNSTVHSVPLTVNIPRGATGAEVWFSNFTGAGSSCQTWDSNGGSNYRFEVESSPFEPVGWLGDVGSSFARDCERRDGVAEPAVLDSYVQQRACAFIEIDTYVPGLTDRFPFEKPNAVFARAVLSLDGKALAPVWLSYSGRAGNNYRYRFTVPKSELYYGPKWATLTYTLQASTDGLSWSSDTARTIRRDVSFCNPAWASCNL